VRSFFLSFLRILLKPPLLSTSLPPPPITTNPLLTFIRTLLTPPPSFGFSTTITDQLPLTCRSWKPIAKMNRCLNLAQDSVLHFFTVFCGLALGGELGFELAENSIFKGYRVIALLSTLFTLTLMIIGVMYLKSRVLNLRTVCIQESATFKYSNRYHY
jgi:hypothetical protein